MRRSYKNDCSLPVYVQSAAACQSGDVLRGQLTLCNCPPSALSSVSVTVKWEELQVNSQHVSCAQCGRLQLTREGWSGQAVTSQLSLVLITKRGGSACLASRPGPDTRLARLGSHRASNTHVIHKLYWLFTMNLRLKTRSQKHLRRDWFLNV